MSNHWNSANEADLIQKLLAVSATGTVFILRTLSKHVSCPPETAVFWERIVFCVTNFYSKQWARFYMSPAVIVRLRMQILSGAGMAVPYVEQTMIHFCVKMSLFIQYYSSTSPAHQCYTVCHLCRRLLPACWQMAPPFLQISEYTVRSASLQTMLPSRQLWVKRVVLLPNVVSNKIFCQMPLFCKSSEETASI